MIAPRQGADLGQVLARVDGGFLRTIGDIRILAGRNFTTAMRRPNALIATAIQPIVFMLLLVAVYGNGLDLPGDLAFIDLVGTAMPLQAAVFVGMTAGGSMALDLQGGMMDRLRSLPVARSAVLASRAVESAVRMVAAVAVVTLVAVALGLRFEAGPGRAVGFLLLAVAFGAAWTWWPLWIAVRTENFQLVSLSQFASFFPLFFLSGALVPVEGLPGWLQPVAWVNPFTPVTEALRACVLGGDLTAPLQASVAWIVCFAVVFGTLSVTRFARIGR